jgi:hypothetical protein
MALAIPHVTGFSHVDTAYGDAADVVSDRLTDVLGVRMVRTLPVPGTKLHAIYVRRGHLSEARDVLDTLDDDGEVPIPGGDEEEG